MKKSERLSKEIVIGENGIRAIFKCKYYEIAIKEMPHNGSFYILVGSDERIEMADSNISHTIEKALSIGLEKAKKYQEIERNKQDEQMRLFKQRFKENADGWTLLK